MKTSAFALMLCLGLSVELYGEGPPPLNVSPEATANGLGFVARVQKSWTVGSQGIWIQLVVTNKTNARIIFPTLDTANFVVYSADGKEVADLFHRTALGNPPPLDISPKDNSILGQDGELIVNLNDICFHAVDEGLTAHELVGLKPGHYFLNYRVESDKDAVLKIATALHRPFPSGVQVWFGHAETEKVPFDIVAH